VAEGVIDGAGGGKNTFPVPGNMGGEGVAKRLDPIPELGRERMGTFVLDEKREPFILGCEDDAESGELTLFKPGLGSATE